MNNSTFLSLCEIFEKIENTKKRLEIQEILTEYLKCVIQTDTESLVPALYLCTGAIAPECQAKELGVGDGGLLKVVSEATGQSTKFVRSELMKTGDLGLIAMKYRVKQLFIVKKFPLRIKDLFNSLHAISNEKGMKSQNSKLSKMLGLVSKCTPLETKYLIRIFEGKLKIGLALKTVLISLAQATASRENDISDCVDNIKLAYNIMPIFERIVPLILQHGPLNILEYVDITPGIPLKPMLAQPSKNISAVFKRINTEPYTCEYKYDGERAQIHRNGSEFKIFSRNSEDLTQKYPDLLEISKFNDANYIIDCEIVAFDQETHKILPFQTLSTRKRRDVKLDSIKVTICVFVFDVLYFKDSSVINLPLHKRKQILKENFIEKKGVFEFAKSIEGQGDIDAIEPFFNLSLKDGCEGLMIKNLNEVYMPSKRSTNWLKLKKDYLEGLCDSLDLVVMGAYYGKGKRTGTYGGFLMGCYDDDNDCYEAICKLGTGFSEQKLKEIYDKLIKIETGKPRRYVYTEGVQPDVWIENRVVWEIRAAGLSLSPIYSAGAKLMDGKGISLRFPRFIRERPDKTCNDCSLSSDVVRMYYESTNEDENLEDSFN
ncbi:DNA ligase 1 [Astathelohania contejeani]|uniref:DNA ligase n=1 Tax=Astathelohania contejeani TaxID=164912 RepID=A0ABQ7I061_9MICR|nr:DNA ligase 1 [Thelohania contejeani]